MVTPGAAESAPQPHIATFNPRNQSTTDTNRPKEGKKAGRDGGAMATWSSAPSVMTWNQFPATRPKEKQV